MYLMHCTSDEKENLWNDNEWVSIFLLCFIWVIKYVCQRKNLLYLNFSCGERYFKNQTVLGSVVRLVSILNICYLATLYVVGCTKNAVSAITFRLLYTAELFEIIASAGLVGHSYADDTQVYISAPATSASVSTQRFISCIECTDAWMRSNRLRMNADKTQLLWLGTRQQLAKLTVTELPLLSAFVKPSSAVLDLGINIDGQLAMADHVATLRRSCLFHLCQLQMVRSSLTLEDAKTLVHAFVRSRLDYCNNLLYEISDGLLTKLQTVQNAAARVVTGTRKIDHITPVLRQLHWLPVRQRITFKLAMITFKCLRGLAPCYLADVCTLFHLLFTGGSCCRPTVGHSSCCALGPWSVGETSLCRARLHGTASVSTCGLHQCPLRHLQRNSKPICSAVIIPEVPI